jgi:hypothetical protein
VTRGWRRAATVAGAGLAAGLTACTAPVRNVDLTSVALQRGPNGELTIAVETDSGPATAVFDTGSPVTFWHRPTAGPATAGERDIRLLGPLRPDGTSPVRAVFEKAIVLETSLGALGPTGNQAAAQPPAALIGADLLADFSVEIGFAAPEVTFWRYISAGDGFLAAGGYAVFRVPRRGGGRLEIAGPADWLGRHPPVEVPASRLILRACGAPASFRREDPLPAQCCVGDLRTSATGVDLSLALSSGTGPIVLGRAAWERLAASLPTPPVFQMRPLHVPTSPTPVPAMWTSVPRLALLDRESDLDVDPGPCAELGRARRLEQVAVLQQRNPDEAACALPCDRPRGQPIGWAENTAAYLELEGDLAVAVVDDTTPFLQAMRAEVRPQGPEVDGIVGAQALATSRAEIDYLGSDLRVIFSCEPTSSEYPPEALPPAPRCRAVGSCPRLPDRTQKHLCFGLPPHGLPDSCNNDNSSCD